MSCMVYVMYSSTKLSSYVMYSSTKLSSTKNAEVCKHTRPILHQPSNKWGVKISFANGVRLLIFNVRNSVLVSCQLDNGVANTPVCRRLNPFNTSNSTLYIYTKSKQASFLLISKFYQYHSYLNNSFC